MSNPTFNNLENTKVYNSFHGWTGETKVKVNGKNWVLSTMKRHNGTISTHCHVVQDEGNGNYSFMMFGDNNPKEDFYLNTLPKGTKATEKTIREAHFKALAEFDAKNEAGELPNAAEEYKIEVGQVIFTDWINGSSSENRRAIYEIEQTKWGVSYRTVSLDGSKTNHDDRIRPYSKKFGIGVYYNEGDKISLDEISNLLIAAKENMEMEAAKEQAQKIVNEAQAKAKSEYLSQFIRADVRTTTNIIKRHILKTWPAVQKVEVKTDSYSGGSSMDVRYYAPEEIKELNDFIDNFQYGHFNGMEDIYENRDMQEIILDGHILQDYKYVFAHFNKVEAPAVVEQPKTEEPVKDQPKEAANVQIIDYSEKAIAVVGDTYPIRESLRNLGGKFNKFLKCGAGWIFSKSKESELKSLLGI
jgi:hypothetical protein